MTHKNPFEVRLDVMKLAQEMLEKEFYAKEQKFLSKLEAIKTENPPSSMTISFIEDNAPIAYTSNDVLARANELYSFVDSNSRRVK